MLSKSFLTILFLGFLIPSLKAQTSDSAKVVKTLQELLLICKTVDFGDPKVLEMGTFYKAAPYIIYRGEDKKREWKDFANYSNAKEKEGVDDICFRINSSVNRDSAYQILSFRTETESEGTWYAIEISYLKKGMPKKAVFAFLKIGDKFGLGDID